MEGFENKHEAPTPTICSEKAEIFLDAREIADITTTLVDAYEQLELIAAPDRTHMAVKKAKIVEKIDDDFVDIMQPSVFEANLHVVTKNDTTHASFELPGTSFTLLSSDNSERHTWKTNEDHDEATYQLSHEQLIDLLLRKTELPNQEELTFMRLLGDISDQQMLDTLQSTLIATDGRQVRLDSYSTNNYIFHYDPNTSSTFTSESGAAIAKITTDNEVRYALKTTTPYVVTSSKGGKDHETTIAATYDYFYAIPEGDTPNSHLELTLKSKDLPDGALRNRLVEEQRSAKYDGDTSDTLQAVIHTIVNDHMYQDIA